MADGLEIRVYKYILSEDFTRRKLYTPEDITESVLQPVMITRRTDTALDTSSLTIINKSKEPLKPFTRFKYEFTTTIEGTPTLEKQYWLVEHDDVHIAKYNADESKRVYKHEISLIEPTKWLERFDVDNTTITNMLMFLYQTDGVVSYPANYTSTYTGRHMQMPSSFSNLINEQYANDHRFMQEVVNLTGSIDIACRMTTQIRYYFLGIPSTDTATLTAFRVYKPDGTRQNLGLNDTQFVAEDSNHNLVEGKYAFYQRYESSNLITGLNWTIEYRWEVNFRELTQYTEKMPTRFNMAQVVDRVLSKVTRENSVRLENETPLFQLDADQRELMETMVAPEFTFTQGTLFDILLQIGIAMHAIPRLKVSDEAGTIWNIIHFDFLGYPGRLDPSGVQINYEKTQNSDNYATAFVSNVQNAFVSSNTSYITITEPFSEGYISTRTESSNFEISPDSCCIKVSRPIQRITELWCLYDKDKEPVDIASYCKEKTDYSLLTDYVYNFMSGIYNYGLGTKETNIYYTRGDNVIRGLDYTAQTVIPAGFAPSWGKQHAIINILIAITGDSTLATKNISELCFRIKYVPYLNFKMKQFRDVIADEMETSGLYFNQNGQQVDINAFGERIKSALNMTSNQEPTCSYISRYPNLYIENSTWMRIKGTIGQYIPYEVQEEISTKSTLTTIRYSKDFNKWNEYDAIKKNYREWEISENECYETNPIYSQFCMICDTEEGDIQTILNEIEYKYSLGEMTDEQAKAYKSSILAYRDELYEKEGFIPQCWNIVGSLFRAFPDDMTIEWIIGKFTSQEWDSADGEYKTIEKEVLFPTTAVAVGNAIVLNIATKDNYSAGTTTERPVLVGTGGNVGGLPTGYRLEYDIPYGSKYGNVEKFQFYAGKGQYDANVTNNIKRISQALDLYLLQNDTAIDQNAVILSMQNNPLMIDKDSRQQFNFTMQLNFISEDENIWISTELTNQCGLTGTATDPLKLVYFNKIPSRFFNGELDYDYIMDADATWLHSVEVRIPRMGILFYMPDFDLQIPLGATTEASKDYVGWGLLDSNNKVVLYYNKVIKTGEHPHNIRFQFRDRI